jgi:hypothetical protein
VTISHSASSGVEASTTAKGSTSTTVAHTGTAYGRMALLMVTVKPATATWGPDPVGWTQVVNVTGATADAQAADTGATRLGVWWKVLLGDEGTGNVTITNSGGNSTGGGMSVYAGTLGAWASPVAVSGDDTAHATARSCVCGAWASALAANDWVAMAYASDTDSTTAFSVMTIAQTSATFGTTVIRNQRLSSTGNQCGMYSGDVPVTAGNANAPTIGYTYSVSQCGRGAAIRLRELSPGVPPDVNVARWL